MQFGHHCHQSLVLASQAFDLLFVSFPLLNRHENFVDPVNSFPHPSWMAIWRIQPLLCFIEHCLHTLCLLLLNKLFVTLHFVFGLVNKGLELIAYLIPICDALVSALHLRLLLFKHLAFFHTYNVTKVINCKLLFHQSSPQDPIAVDQHSQSIRP